MTEKICANCGKKFSPRYDSQKFCSKKCSHEIFYQYDKQKPIDVKIKVCFACGKNFKHKFKNEKFCSDSCRENYFNVE